MDENTNCPGLTRDFWSGVIPDTYENISKHLMPKVDAKLQQMHMDILYTHHVVNNLHKLYGILIWGNTCKPYIAAENGPLEQFHFSTTRVTQALCLCCLTAHNWQK